MHHASYTMVVYVKLR